MLLFAALTGFFVANALVAEFIGVKIFSLDLSLGLEEIKYKLFGQDSAPQFTVGVLLWPLVFIMTDVVNEYFGQRGVRFMSFAAATLITYAFIIVNLGIVTVPAPWWTGSYAETRGLEDAQLAYSVIFGQGTWIIAGSLIAFLVGQILDAWVFHRIRRITGDGKVWLRATFSTFISQFIDSYIVIYIAFVLGPPKWSMAQFFSVSTNNYILKCAAAILLLPLIYAAHALIDRYLGKKTAAKLRREASA